PSNGPSDPMCNVAAVQLTRTGQLKSVSVIVPAEVAKAITGPDPDGLGGSFVRFSRGGAAPAFAPKVRLLYDGRHVRTISAAKAAERSSWWVCVSEMVSNCPLLTEIAALARTDLSYDRDDPGTCPLGSR